MPKFRQLARSVMPSRASLHANEARRNLAKCNDHPYGTEVSTAGVVHSITTRRKRPEQSIVGPIPTAD